MQECDQFINNKNLYNICVGNSTLPKWKLNNYREKFGLTPLFTEEEVINEKKSKSEISLNYNNVGYGVGTELLYIYKDSGVPACQACFKLAKQMNMWGPDKCIENLQFIIDDIMPRAKDWIAENKPWAHKLLPNIIEEVGIKIAVKNSVMLAIENFKNKLNVKSITVNKGGCNCGK